MTCFQRRFSPAAVSWVLLSTAVVSADGTNHQLDIYFIDVEGGAATLFVTPRGESLLVDSGYPERQGRDRDRILNVVRDVAGLQRIDHALVTHWHLDHYGNHAALARKISIRHFWDRGIPDRLAEDPKFPERIAAYRAATHNRSRALTVGDRLPLKSGTLPLSLTIVTASRRVIRNTGRPNPYAKQNHPKPIDKTDNAASLGFLLKFGRFRYLCCGDLTWNIEAKLVSPNNPLGKVDLFMVTHHGLAQSNNPVLVRAIDPRVAVMCNGPIKGGHPDTTRTLRSGKSLLALYQLHRNLKLKADEQAPAPLIANQEPTTKCPGRWIKASVAAGGASYTLQVGRNGKPRTYTTRGTTAESRK